MENYLNVFVTATCYGTRFTLSREISRASFKYYYPDSLYLDSECEIGSVGEALIDAVRHVTSNTDIELFPYELIIYPSTLITDDILLKIVEAIKNTIDKTLKRVYNSKFTIGDMSNFKFEKN